MIVDDFRTEMLNDGLEPPDDINPGTMHRFPGVGKRTGNRAGWCFMFEDAQGGCYGDWSSDLSKVWQPRRAKPYSTSEQARFKRQVSEARQKVEVEHAEKQAAAAEKARTIWDSADAATANHQYLRDKDVEVHGVRVHEGDLIIPMHADGEIQSLQRIRQDGTKLFHTGGRVKACYFTIGKTDGADTLYIAEGFATAATIHEAIGGPVVVAFNAGNLKPVAKAMREKSPDLKIVVCADNDQWTEGNPGVTRATETAKAIGGSVVVPEFSDTTSKPTDFNDLHCLEGLDEVRRQIKTQAKEPEPISKDNMSDEAQFTELAELSPVEYDRKRKEVAKEMGIQLGTLDQEVEARRKKTKANTVEFEDIKPWPDPVAGGEMMAELLRTIKEHIQISEPKRIAIALWIIFTYLHDSAPISPMLAVTSPSKRCGKTTLLCLLTHLCSRALPTNNITSAALFRVVEKYGPTLLIDEGDTFLGQNDELRGIINSGHTRLTAWVIRNTGDDHEPTRFTTWAPKVIAMIKHPPDTIQDRSVEIRMERKRPEDRIKRLRLDATPEILRLKRKVARFSQDNEAAFKSAKPVLPDSLHDRAKDNWEPLVSIAELIGGEWVTRAIDAAKTLTPGEDKVANILLLEDCQRLFEDRNYYRPTDLCDALVKLEDRPWSDWSRGKPITANRLGRLISDFKTKSGHDIKSCSRRDGGFAGRAYWKDDFEDAFSRYLSPTPFSGKKSGTTAQVNNGAGLSDIEKRHTDSVVPELNSLKPNNGAGCADVPQFTGDIEEKTKNSPDFDALFPPLDTQKANL